MSGKRRGRRVKKVSTSGSNNSDDDDETTTTTPITNKTESTTPSKKKRAPIIKVETLLLEQRWPEVRKRLKRIASPKRIGSLLHHTADNPNVPDDIFQLLLAKLDGKREYKCPVGGSQPWSIRYEFWGCVCNVNAEDVYAKKFGKVCKHRSPSSLRIFLQEYANLVGKLHVHSARETIQYLWVDYIFPDGSYSYSEQMPCPKIKQEELIRLASKEDEESNNNVSSSSNQVLHDLWEKTVLLIQMTVQDGLEKSVNDNEFPLIHTMISAELPKLLIWLALKLYPHQTRVQDGLGRLPLHWAAATLNNTRTENGLQRVSFEEIDDLKTKETTMLELVLNAFPAGAGYTDAKGSHPLALLLDLDYKSWPKNSDGTIQRCVMALLKQAPEALHETNGENGMLPFMTAACMHEDNTFLARTKCEALRQLDLTYDILRQDPLVVTRGIKDTSREIYLKQQLKEAQTMIQKLEAEKRKLQDEVTLLKSKNNKNVNNDDDDYDDHVEPASQKRRSKRTRLNN